MNLPQRFYSVYLLVRPFVYVIFTQQFLFDFYLLDGRSMEPTFANKNEIVLIEKFSKYFIPYRNDEIVAVRNPIDPSMVLCKRIKASAGETVKGLEIPSYNYWVEGDNKGNSFDSRQFGSVSGHLIEGRVYFRLWPLPRAGFI